MRPEVTVRRLGLDDCALIAGIDRSEDVDAEYAVCDGALSARAPSMPSIPSWDPGGAGPHSVAHQIEMGRDLIRDGATLLGAFDADQNLGLAVVHPCLEPGLAWAAFLYVSRPHRGVGVASALWLASLQAAHVAGAQRLYVSAIATSSAVGFYLARGCTLADPPHPVLYGAEPDDIHLVCDIRLRN